MSAEVSNRGPFRASRGKGEDPLVERLDNTVFRRGGAVIPLMLTKTRDSLRLRSFRPAATRKHFVT